MAQCSIDYYVSLQSPWTYLGHQRVVRFVRENGIALTVYPLDFSKVFPATGGLPLPKRAPARQQYRMLELKRWQRYLGLPLNVSPDYYPVDDKPAQRLVVAAREFDDALAVDLAGAILTAVWAENADISDVETLRRIVAGRTSDAEKLLASTNDSGLDEQVAADSERAVERGVFGAPSFICSAEGRDSELFWGQDRLEFVERYFD